MGNRTRTTGPSHRVDRVRELQGQLTAEVGQLIHSDAWQQMLATAARFHQYSLGNLLLIQAQRPGATRVAGYRCWQAVGRHVRKGERGIAILAPCTYRAATVAPDESEALSVLKGFRVVHVFDESQTDGETIHEIRPRLLTGEGPAGLWEGLAAVVTTEGFSLLREWPTVPGANGETDWSARTVIVRPDLEPAAACKTLAHELAHVRCGHGHQGSEYCRSDAEVEAESIAYVVLGAVGIDSAAYSGAYVAGWSGSDLAAVRRSAERVVAISQGVLREITVDGSQLRQGAAEHSIVAA